MNHRRNGLTIRSILVVLITSFVFVSTLLGYRSSFAQDVPIPIPRVLDNRLKIELFASEPELVTPAGIDVDANGNVYVIESHTHFRPEGYKGPIADRIRRFRDEDGDGKAEQVTTFFQGTFSTMSLAVHPDGAVYVATRNEVFRLRDRDGNGVADENTTLAKLKTTGTYPHNGLSGFAFDLQGNVFFGFGENLGEDYDLVGSDGTTLSGGGEGGSIFRCDLDGRNLERWATGFWNPFHLCFDDYGQLFAVDNDPDWRPPCRLLHVVRGGDYGYRFTLGRRGTHPFSSWFGDVPGTLGMVCGTGEAPSGVLSYQSNALPAEYQGTLLATSWGIHAIERFRLSRAGATYSSNAETIIKGGEDFRPVGIAIGPNGSLYVSDWVKRSYELHGHGRVWKISPVKPVATAAAESIVERFASIDRSTSQQAAVDLAGSEEGIAWLLTQLDPEKQSEPRLRSLAFQVLVAKERVTDETMFRVLSDDPKLEVRLLAARLGPITTAVIALIEEQLTSEEIDLVEAQSVAAEMLRQPAAQGLTEIAWQLCESSDPFMLQAARMAISRSLSSEELAQMAPPDSPSQRLQWALVLMNHGDSTPNEVVEKLLIDSDPQVRFVALRWIGERRLVDFKDKLADRMRADPQIGQLFESYLAAMDLLQGERTGAQYEKQEINLLNKMVLETVYSENRWLVDIALRRLVTALQRDREQALPAALESDFLSSLAAGDADHQGSLEAIYAIRDVPREDAAETLAKLLLNNLYLTDEQKVTAISGIDIESQAGQAVMRRFMVPSKNRLRPPAEVEREVLRLWINQDIEDAASEPLNALVDTVPAYREDVMRLLDPEGLQRTRPPGEDVDAWIEMLEESDGANGDVVAGERLFFHPRIARCAVCHQVDGRGGNIGPDLSHAAQLGQRRLIESIVQPSREIAPKFTAWTLVTADGKVRTGVLVTERGSDQIYADAEGASFQVHFNDIEDRTPSRKSLMPDGLLEELTGKEIRDLLAYLQSLK